MDCYKWDALFIFSSPIEEKSVKELPYIKFEKEIQDSKIKLKGFIVYTTEASKNLALIDLLEKANRVLDYMTAMHQVPIECSLNNWGEVKPPGLPKTRETGIPAGGNIISKEFLNFLSVKPSLEDRMQPNELQLMRQLSHYRRGVDASEDIITQIREFYMVLEDEYAGTSNSILPRYSYIRHFVSHSEMDELDKQGRKLKSYDKATDKYGQHYVDYSKPEIIKRIIKDIPNIKNESEKIIGRKIR
jgi:hypothetical protein